MPLREDILNPIAGENPAGRDLRYDAVYDKLKELRREDDDAPQGDWQHERKTADYPKIIATASEAIALKSKDLQLAAWLTEALLKKEGFAGLKSGLDLIRGMLDQYWDNLFPELDPEDEEDPASLRAKPLDWLGGYCDVPVRLWPLTAAGHHSLQYKEARQVGFQPTDQYDEKAIQAYAQAQEEGKITGEVFEAG